MDITTRILKIMDERKTNAAQLTREIGLTNGLITQWKQKKQKPSVENLIKIANFFEISLDYLLTGKEVIEMKSPAIGGRGQMCMDLFGVADVSETTLNEVRRYARMLLLENANKETENQQEAV